jgi:Zn-dependent M28 family amino/carboxypeptidase
MSVKQQFERLTSRNFVAMVEGTDPRLKEEFIVFTAHWDHLGRGRQGEIYRGARDNALGCSALLECARALQKLPDAKRKRSALFLFTTCEEQILLGSLHYVANPLVPLRKTIACLNVDVMSTFGKTKDMSYSGKGFSDIDALVVVAAKRQNRTVTGEHTPETVREIHHIFSFLPLVINL